MTPSGRQIWLTLFIGWALLVAASPIRAQAAADQDLAPSWSKVKSSLQAQTYEEALAGITALIEQAIERSGPDSDDVLHFRGLQAEVLTRLGQLEEALEIEQDVYKRRTNAFGIDNPRTLDAELYLAITLSTLGRFDEATGHLEHLLKEQENLDPSVRLETRRLLLRVYRASKKNELAADLERELAAQVEFDVHEYSRGLDARELEELRGELARLECRKKYLERLATESKPASLDEIQSELDEGTLVLAYDIGRQSSRAFVLTKDSLVVRALSTSRDELWLQTDRFLQMNMRSGRESPAERRARLAMGNWLYANLLEPFRQQIDQASRLVILPTPPLQYLPFSAIPIPDTNLLTIRPTAVLFHYEPLYWAYLAALKPTSFARSFTALLSNIRRQKDVAFEYEWSGFGANFDLALPEGQRLPELPAVDEEIQQIFQLYRRKQLSAQAFTGSETSKSLVLAALSNSRLVHIAAHGVSPNPQPDKELEDYPGKTQPKYPRVDASAAFLSLGGNSSAFASNSLRACELPTEIRSELVVLSACPTSFGSNYGALPGSVPGTVLALLMGGASVLTSSWPVDDEATRELMTRFYTNLLKGQTTHAEALKEAQFELMLGSQFDTPDHSAPYYWAGFHLHGD